MRVWIINQYVVPPEQAGFTRHYALARQLARLGHEVTVVTGSFNHSTREQMTLAPDQAGRIETREGIQFVWIRALSYSGNGLKRMASMLDFAAKVRRRAGFRSLPAPDVIFSSSPHLFASAAALKLADMFDVPMVLEVRDLWPKTFIELGGYSPWHPAILWMQRLERMLYRRAAKIVTLPPNAGSHLEQNGAAPQKIVWIPNGVDLDLVPKPDSGTKAKDSENFTVMYAGAHGLANDLRTIVEAADLLKTSGVRFRFIGDGPDKQSLQDLVHERKLDNVQFESTVSRRDVYGKLQEADLLVAVLRDSPLYKHGVSLNKLYDFMAAGRPVVFGAQSFNNPIEEAQAGLTVPPQNAPAMAAAIARMAAMSELERGRMGNNGRRFVEQHHSSEILGARLESVLLAATGAEHAARIAAAA